jgi:hypothetical protein
MIPFFITIPLTTRLRRCSEAVAAGPAETWPGAAVYVNVARQMSSPVRGACRSLQCRFFKNR